MGAGQRRELHAGAAHAPGGAADKDTLAEREVRLTEERVEGGRERLHEAAGLGPGDPVRHRQGVRFVDRRQRRLGAAADERHDAVSRREPRDAPPHTHDLAGELQAGDVRRPAGRRRIASVALGKVGAVHPGGSHGDEQLVVAGPGIGPLLPVKLSFIDHDCVHGAPPGSVLPDPRQEANDWREARRGLQGAMEAHRRAGADRPAASPRRLRRYAATAGLLAAILPLAGCGDRRGRMGEGRSHEPLQPGRRLRGVGGGRVPAAPARPTVRVDLERRPALSEERLLPPGRGAGSPGACAAPPGVP